jgi:hypothetical protein
MSEERAQLREGSWENNVGGFERHYAGWLLESPDGNSLVARRKVNGRAQGKRLRGRTLDDLARLIEEAGP